MVVNWCDDALATAYIIYKYFASHAALLVHFSNLVLCSCSRQDDVPNEGHSGGGKSNQTLFLNGGVLLNRLSLSESTVLFWKQRRTGDPMGYHSDHSLRTNLCWRMQQ